MADYKGWSDSVQNIIELMQTPDVWALFNHPPAETYHKGRVCLLGDAAHATTPHNGAGAGMAIEDVYILGNLLAETSDTRDIEHALASYNAARKVRSQKLVEHSREQGCLYDLELGIHEPEQLASTLLSRMDWLWKYDLTLELEDARKLLKAKQETN